MTWNPAEHPRDETGRFISLYELEQREAAAIDAEAAKPKTHRRSMRVTNDIDIPIWPVYWNSIDHYPIQDGVGEIPTPLFHGTDREFQPGDIITPRTKKVAHATRSIGTARVFGEHVYRVEPVCGWTAEVWQHKMKYTQGEHHTEHLTKHGYRVVSEVPDSVADSDFDNERRAMREEWMRKNNVEWCKPCQQYHTPNNHRNKS